MCKNDSLISTVYIEKWLARNVLLLFLLLVYYY